MKYIYIEKDLREHPRAKKILKRFKDSQVIECDHYAELFNVKAQNFRLQKSNPCLILAKKNNQRVLPTPESFGIGGEQNFYFSHMLNCLYDCRYCFLQGMYHSANYVLFINYEDFQQSILETLTKVEQQAYFFSGYDCDSLAYEPVTGFVENFLPFFREHPSAILELRTKSTNIKPLLKQSSFANCITAFSFTPHEISEAIEHKVPSVEKRIKAMQTLAHHGWNIGLRFDPLIYKKDFEQQYRELIKAIFQNLDTQQVHSVSVGPMRFPAKMFQKLTKLYPEEPLFAQPLVKRDNHFTYQSALEDDMKQFIFNELKSYMDQTLIFECNAL